jgi:transposase
VKDFYSNSEVINLILDGAGYHRSNEVKEAAKRFNIKLHYLPPYRPNLNPIKRLWKVMNMQEMGSILQRQKNSDRKSMIFLP